MGKIGKISNIDITPYKEVIFENMKDVWVDSEQYPDLTGDALLERKDIAEIIYEMLLRKAPRGKNKRFAGVIKLTSHKSVNYIFDIPVEIGGEKYIRMKFTNTVKLLSKLGSALGFQSVDNKNKVTYEWISEEAKKTLGNPDDEQYVTHASPNENKWTTDPRLLGKNLYARGDIAKTICVCLQDEHIPRKDQKGKEHEINYSSSRSIDLNFTVPLDESTQKELVSFYFTDMNKFKRALATALGDPSMTVSVVREWIEGRWKS